MRSGYRQLARAVDALFVGAGVRRLRAARVAGLWRVEIPWGWTTTEGVDASFLDAVAAAACVACERCGKRPESSGELCDACANEMAGWPRGGE